MASSKPVRGKTAQYECEGCKLPFLARTADRARGWARYCSKSCKARVQERTTGNYKAHLSRELGDEWEYTDADGITHGGLCFPSMAEGEVQ